MANFLYSCEKPNSLLLYLQSVYKILASLTKLSAILASDRNTTSSSPQLVTPSTNTKLFLKGGMMQALNLLNSDRDKTSITATKITSDIDLILIAIIPSTTSTSRDYSISYHLLMELKKQFPDYLNQSQIFPAKHACFNLICDDISYWTTHCRIGPIDLEVRFAFSSNYKTIGLSSIQLYPFYSFS